MPSRLLLTLCILLSAVTPAAAQGLIAYPWKECPQVPLPGGSNETEPRCVWVTDARHHSGLRPGETIEGTLGLDALNPGGDAAQVVVQVRSRGGLFVREFAATIAPGVTHQFRRGVRELEDWGHNHGIWVIRSDRPVLLWAWHIEHHLANPDLPPTAMSTTTVPIYPVDCSDPLAAKSFAWVCGASQPPPGPG